MESIIIQADAKKMKALKAFLKAFGIAYKIDKTAEKESPYDPDFVKKVLEANKGDRIPYTDALKKELFGK